MNYGKNKFDIKYCFISLQNNDCFLTIYLGKENITFYF